MTISGSDPSTTVPIQSYQPQGVSDNSFYYPPTPAVPIVNIYDFKPNVGAAEYGRLYTANKLTLAQAVYGLRQYFLTNSTTGYTSSPTLDDLSDFIGHRLHPDDVTQIEIGYEGSFSKWIEDGNKPKGWFQLFKDNYPMYKDDCGNNDKNVRDNKRDNEANG